MSAGGDLLKSELAGVWYPEEPKRLAREVDVYLDANDAGCCGGVMALILPHAGYRYSGMVAAAGVKQLIGRTFSRVIVMGPSHRVSLMDTVSMPDVSAIETPLGQIELDRVFMDKLWGSEYFISRPDAHASEHSVQIELPFLQRALGEFKLVPMVCGELSETAALQIGRVLCENMDPDTLVVASSDFTHYGQGFDYIPFEEQIPAHLRSLDLGAFEAIKKRDLHGFLEYIQKTGATICGRSAIAVLLAMLPDTTAEVQLLKYDTSGNLTGDWSHCVSYLSAVVSGKWPAAGADGALGKPELTDSDKIGLLRLARHCIASSFRKDDMPAWHMTPGMQKTMGAFVTLHKDGQLRGCIGEISPHRALFEAVKEQAVNAAFYDPRFPRLQEAELGTVDIEISALTAPQPIPSYREILIGKHGIVLSKDSRSAVFLPQVPIEQGWDLPETLTQLSLKAGLDPDAWQSACEFQVFEAIVFGEKSPEGIF
jgi:AmmeMemoRadiSam system protein B/AmmeMemoRadiSam system protein A